LSIIALILAKWCPCENAQTILGANTGFRLASFELSRRQWLKLAGAGAATGVMAVGVEGVVLEPQHPQLERVEVTLRRLPQQLDGLTVAQMSDFHYHPHFTAGVIETAVKIVTRLNADLVVLTGDYITVPQFEKGAARRAGALQGAEPIARLLAPLRARHGVFAVLGNHDQHADAEFVTGHLRKRGIEVLRNQALPVERSGARIWLTGLDDLVEGGRPDLGRLLCQIPPGEPTVLLVHEPDFADEAAKYAIDLQLAGHSHGGQIRLPMLGAVYLPKMARKYPWGLRQIGALTLYTNRGIGTIGIPVRLNCAPEITLLTLRSLQA
jgi:predicted MPP superfamily phosphohydrolase